MSDEWDDFDDWQDDIDGDVEVFCCDCGEAFEVSRSHSLYVQCCSVCDSLSLDCGALFDDLNAPEYSSLDQLEDTESIFGLDISSTDWVCCVCGCELDSGTEHLGYDHRAYCADDYAEHVVDRGSLELH